ncbi:SDR family NAD(P)-dependent oxidoreductase [Paraburkholderia sp. BR10936]|uniref:SDR family NAD(P)-dependent oxidoreductase n=1 Tax=Paraburkholderia sp. BR10936 TaxID=3236993 RepID=UPI0034D30D97
MKASFDASGDVIVITGGANGIGAALARACAGAGAAVIVCDVDEHAAAALLAAEPRLQFVRLDVSDRDAVMAAMQSIENEHGHIDGLVCAAAVQPRRAVHDTAPADWQRTLGINLDGVVWCYQAAMPGMIRRRRGSVLAFSSGLAHSGWADSAAYAASKAALVAFIKSAAKEVARHRVRVNLIAPGVIDTPQYRHANAGSDDAHWAATLGVGQPEDVTGPLMFLLSDAATMTASVLSRDYAWQASEPAGHEQ